jgi:hypothetical protein
MNEPRQPANPYFQPQPRVQPPPQHGGPPHAPAAPSQGGLRPAHVVQPHAAPRMPQQHPQHPHPQHPQPASAEADDADLVELSEDDDSSLALIDDDAPATAGGMAAPLSAVPKEPKKIIKFDAGALYRDEKWKRMPTSSGTGPIRVKSFHGKVSEQGLEYIDHAINEFLDNHPEIEVKNVTSNVCMFDGKFRDFALIINVWY